MENFKMFSYQVKNVHVWKRLIPGKAAEYIERLSRYMASNDMHYANHYATIKKWLDEDSKGRSAKNYTYDDNEGECL